MGNTEDDKQQEYERRLMLYNFSTIQEEYLPPPDFYTMSRLQANVYPYNHAQSRRIEGVVCLEYFTYDYSERGQDIDHKFTARFTGPNQDDINKAMAGFQKIMLDVGYEMNINFETNAVDVTLSHPKKIRSQTEYEDLENKITDGLEALQVHLPIGDNPTHLVDQVLTCLGNADLERNMGR